MNQNEGVTPSGSLCRPAGEAADASSAKPAAANASRPWTRDMALDLCRILERIAPEFGAHIGLTGGLLYKDGPRKDCDILIYRIRQAAEIDVEGLFAAFARVADVNKTSGFSWCHKAEWHGLPIDFFFPEEPGEYEGFDEAAHAIDMSFQEIPL